MGSDLGDSNHVLGSDESLVNYSDNGLVSSEGSNQLSNSSSDSSNLSNKNVFSVNQSVDDLSESLNDLWSWSANNDGLWKSSQWS